MSASYWGIFNGHAVHAHQTSIISHQRFTRTLSRLMNALLLPDLGLLEVIDVTSWPQGVRGIIATFNVSLGDPNFWRWSDNKIWPASRIHCPRPFPWCSSGFWTSYCHDLLIVQHIKYCSLRSYRPLRAVNNLWLTVTNTLCPTAHPSQSFHKKEERD